MDMIKLAAARKRPTDEMRAMFRAVLDAERRLYPGDTEHIEVLKADMAALVETDFVASMAYLDSAVVATCAVVQR